MVYMWRWLWAGGKAVNRSAGVAAKVQMSPEETKPEIKKQGYFVSPKFSENLQWLSTLSQKTILWQLRSDDYSSGVQWTQLAGAGSGLS